MMHKKLMEQISKNLTRLANEQTYQAKRLLDLAMDSERIGLKGGHIFAAHDAMTEAEKNQKSNSFRRRVFESDLAVL